jgi:hypothetical protein
MEHRVGRYPQELRERAVRMVARHHRSTDLVGRNFASPEPNRLWVADI